MLDDEAAARVQEPGRRNNRLPGELQPICATDQSPSAVLAALRGKVFVVGNARWTGEDKIGRSVEAGQ
jgi:hypothetical protein